ncbi:hypothetical protein J5N97_021841 [Dioscorea zingiberensis]|uniref:Uncharacterized protein n=1 Tax=Dioscorea zingiberensis TaxID=325984 RepID=A0A9D5C9W1_9LILI|nr:hypothetical protein J5N97_021841 [Dioscorea zingiberensis]
MKEIKRSKFSHPFLSLDFIFRNPSLSLFHSPFSPLLRRSLTRTTACEHIVAGRPCSHLHSAGPAPFLAALLPVKLRRGGPAPLPLSAHVRLPSEIRPRPGSLSPQGSSSPQATIEASSSPNFIASSRDLEREAFYSSHGSCPSGTQLPVLVHCLSYQKTTCALCVELQSRITQLENNNKELQESLHAMRDFEDMMNK